MMALRNSIADLGPDEDDLHLLQNVAGDTARPRSPGQPAYRNNGGGGKIAS